MGICVYIFFANDSDSQFPGDTATALPATVRNTQTFTTHIHDHG